MNLSGEWKIAMTCRFNMLDKKHILRGWWKQIFEIRPRRSPKLSLKIAKNAKKSNLQLFEILQKRQKRGQFIWRTENWYDLSF